MRYTRCAVMRPTARLAAARRTVVRLPARSGADIYQYPLLRNSSAMWPHCPPSLSGSRSQTFSKFQLITMESARDDYS
eukprot:8650464-Pyramimonas_sp.AAC.1